MFLWYNITTKCLRSFSKNEKRPKNKFGKSKSQKAKSHLDGDCYVGFGTS